MSIFSNTARIERSDAPVLTRPSVPWKTVMALAVVLAYADGFWLTSLRGAIGAIERTQSPFVSWLQESTVVLPVFVLAVLSAFTLAIRWFGPELRRPRTLVATALLIVAACTLVGLIETVASSVYDYHLQSQQILTMGSMSTLPQDALAQQQHATLVVHIHGVLYIGRWLLLTNLVLVAWLVAMWGGRLTLSRQHRAPDRPTGSAGGVGASRTQDVRLLLVATLVASALIHAAVVPAHLSEWTAAGMFLVLLAIWELAVAGLLLARLEERIMLLAAAAVSVAPLLVLWPRNVGLLFGPDTGTADGISLPGLMASTLAIVSLVAALTLLRAGNRPPRPPASAHVRGLVVVGLIAVTVIGLAGVGLSWFDAFGISDVHPVMTMPH